MFWAFTEKSDFYGEGGVGQFADLRGGRGGGLGKKEGGGVFEGGLIP